MNLSTSIESCLPKRLKKNRSEWEVVVIEVAQPTGWLLMRPASQPYNAALKGSDFAKVQLQPQYQQQAASVTRQ